MKDDHGNVAQAVQATFALCLLYPFRIEAKQFCSYLRELYGNVHAVTEHELQEQLTTNWMDEPPEVDNLGKLSLLAWEVMFPSWKINDKWAGFGEPAVDFVFINERSDFVLVELKIGLSRGELLKALCQVSHQAILFRESYSAEKLLAVFVACKAGATRRKINHATGEDAFKTSLVAYGDQVKPLNVIRVVAATRFPKSFEDDLHKFNSSTHAEIMATQVARYKPDRTLKRFAAIFPPSFDLLACHPIQLLFVKGIL